MKLFDAFRLPRQVEQFEAAIEAAFHVDEEAVPPSVFGLSAYLQPGEIAARIDRRAALQVPAVKRGVELIAGTLATLPIDLLDPQKAKISRTLFEQPEKDRPRSVTMSETYTDLVLEGHAWWLITDRMWGDWPVHVRRLDPRSINVKHDSKIFVTREGHYGSYTEWVPDGELIHFESPNEPLLVAGARAIRQCIDLDRAAARFAEGVPPLDYFTPADGADPADDDDILTLLAEWQAARQTRGTAYVPAALEYHSNGFNPEQLQMADAREHAIKDLARVMGIDPIDLGISITTHTYQNTQDRYQSRIKDTLRGYMVALEERLSMPDVTPRGYVAKTNLSDFLRSDDLSRFQAYEVGRRVGALTDEEIRTAEGKAPLSAADTPPALPAPEEAQA